MKRYITSATSHEFFHPALDDFVKAGEDAGYTVTIQGDDFETAIIDVQPTNDKDLLPKLTCWFNTKGSGDENIIYYECTAEFKDISTEDLKYIDTAEKSFDKLEKVFDFITWMMKNSIELDQWLDE